MRRRLTRFKCWIMVTSCFGSVPLGWATADDKVVTTTAKADPLADWSRSSMTSTNCSARFPAKPTEKSGQVTTLGVVAGGMRFEIGASETMPERARREFSDARKAQKALDEVREMIIQVDPGSMLVSEGDARVGEVPGRECLMKAKNGTYWRMRLYYDRGRLYYTLVVCEKKDEVASERSTAYLDSLRLPREPEPR